jgi:hypothetical protein
MLDFVRQWQAMRRLGALTPEERAIVFYSEGPAYWPHLEPIIRNLGDLWDGAFCYVSSDPRDPGLTFDPDRVRGFWIGDGVVRNVFFQSVEARVLVMTMPDLHTLEIKRSRFPAHYVFVAHSMVSTHMIYRKDAFDHFDTIFCVGPHHVSEIREAEALNGLPPKNLFAHGYGRLDAIIEAAGMKHPRSSAPEVLVAPSWGPEGLLETCGEDLVRVLVDAGLRTIVRPHPQTRRYRADVLENLIDRFGGNNRFRLEEDMASQESLHTCDIMVSDWSGAALEYAFGIGRPVLFVDVPRKINNPEYERFKSVPIEVSIRDHIGRVVSPSDFARVPEMIANLTADPASFEKVVRKLREQNVFNIGNSGREGAARIAELATGSENSGHD